MDGGQSYCVDFVELWIIRSLKTEGDVNISHPSTRGLVGHVYAKKNSGQHVCPLKEKVSIRSTFFRLASMKD